jgi:hypothetical protein
MNVSTSILDARGVSAYFHALSVWSKGIAGLVETIGGLQMRRICDLKGSRIGGGAEKSSFLHKFLHTSRPRLLCNCLVACQNGDHCLMMAAASLAYLNL